MNQTEIPASPMPWAARREIFQLALKPSARIWCPAGRKRPWNEGCGQLARIAIVVSAPSGASENVSEPPSSRSIENATF